MQRVLNYDRDSQRNLLGDLLGDAGPWRIALAFAGISSTIFFAFAFFHVFQRRRQYRRVEDRLIQAVLRRASRRGYVRKPEETLGQFADRVLIDEPKFGVELKRLAGLYSSSVYAEDTTAAHRLQIATRQFLRPKKYST